MNTLLVSHLSIETDKWTKPVNEIRAWAYALKCGTYCPWLHSMWCKDDFKQYDFLMVERKHCEPFAQWAVNNGIKVLLIEEGPLNDNNPHLDEWSKRMTLWDSVNCVGTVNDVSDIELVQSLTSTAVIDATTPYPYEFTQKLVTPYHDRKFILVPDRSYIFNIAVMRQFPQEQFVTTVLIDKNTNIEKMQQLYHSMGIDNITIYKYTDWDAYVTSILRHAKAAISLDPRQSCNRFAKDCAAFKIPMIGSSTNFVANYLFSDFTVDMYDVNKAVDMLNNVLTHNTKDRVNYANAVLAEQYDMEPSRQRFTDDLARVGMIW